MGSCRVRVRYVTFCSKGEETKGIGVIRIVAFILMDKLKSCCGSFCGCMGKACECFADVLRKKPSLYVLMFLCLFWATFNIVLSSMSLFQVYDRNPIRGAGFPDCSVNDACNSNCGGLVNRRTAQVNVPNPLEITVGDNRGNIALRMLCTWPIGPNASRFSCAISCIIMFICVFIWAYRTIYPQYSKIYHVIPFLAADAWWWAVMITDATEIIKSNASCQELQVRATITGAWAINVRPSQYILRTRVFLILRVAVRNIKHSHLHCALRRRLRALFLDPLHFHLLVVTPAPSCVLAAFCAHCPAGIPTATFHSRLRPKPQPLLPRLPAQNPRWKRSLLRRLSTLLLPTLMQPKRLQLPLSLKSELDAHNFLAHALIRSAIVPIFTKYFVEPKSKTLSFFSHKL